MKVKKILALSLSVAMLAGGALSVSAQGVSDVFNAKYYASKNSDLAAAGVTSDAALLQHAVNSGIAEDRDVSPILDVAEYATYPDLKAAFGNDWNAYVDHYLQFGIKEGRTKGVKFDLVDYANKNADIKAAYGEDYTAIANHYVNYGINENRPGGQIVAKTTASTAKSSNTGSSSSNSNATGSTGSTTEDNTNVGSQTTAPSTDIESWNGIQHDWTAKIKNGDHIQIIARETATCQHSGYITYRCTEMVVYTDSGKWMRYEDARAKGETVDGHAITMADASQCAATHTVTSAALHHKVPADGVYLAHPTCTEAGKASYVCELCGTYVENEEVPALGHVWVDSKYVTATSCDEAGKGYTEQTCSRCGAKQQINVYYKHSIAKYTVTIPATCTSQGEEHGYCSVCKYEDVRKTDMILHVNSEQVAIGVDTEINGQPAHATYYVTYCKNCNTIRWVSTDVDHLARTLCEDPDKDGYCDVCHRLMDRTINSEKLYSVGEQYNKKLVQ